MQQLFIVLCSRARYRPHRFQEIHGPSSIQSKALFELEAASTALPEPGYQVQPAFPNEKHEGKAGCTWFLNGFLVERTFSRRDLKTMITEFLCC